MFTALLASFRSSFTCLNQIKWYINTICYYNSETSKFDWSWTVTALLFQAVGWCHSLRNRHECKPTNSSHCVRNYTLIHNRSFLHWCVRTFKWIYMKQILLLNSTNRPKGSVFLFILSSLNLFRLSFISTLHPCVISFHNVLVRMVRKAAFALQYKELFDKMGFY